MPNTNTKIQIKRTDKQVSNLSTEPLAYGEPLFLEVDETKNKYLAIGNDGTDSKVSDATFFEGITDTQYLGKTVFIDSNGNAVTQNNDEVSVSKLSINRLELSTATDNIYYLVLCSSGGRVYAVQENKGLYVTSNGVLRGSAWNDFAEARKCLSGKPGQVVCENGDGTLSLSERKLQILPHVISDTCGISIGATNELDESNLDIAVAGRVLVYVNCDVEIGDVLCADKDGYATVMDRHEISLYPDRILGIVSEIPTYTKWNNKVDVDGRVWISIK